MLGARSGSILFKEPLKTGVIVLICLAIIYCLISVHDWAENRKNSEEDLLHTDATEKFIVHYVLFHNNLNPMSSNVTFMECISILSVIKELRPDAIYLHTNVPEFWPFEPCRPYISDTSWTNLQVMHKSRRHVIDGKRIYYNEHEADIAKMEILLEYGGFALDFDVYIINGDKIKSLWKKHACIICYDVFDEFLNTGFLGCHRGAQFPELILTESYFKKYEIGNWLYNSGVMSYEIHIAYPGVVHPVSGVCDVDRNTILRKHNLLYNWPEQLAYHSTFHDPTFTNATLEKLNSTFAEILRSIMFSTGTGLPT